MGLDLWFKEDVARILASTQTTVNSQRTAYPAADPAYADAYQRGFDDALNAVAVAFGVRVPQSSCGEVWRLERR